jgi:hypothetical protein
VADEIGRPSTSSLKMTHNVAKVCDDVFAGNHSNGRKIASSMKTEVVNHCFSSGWPEMQKTGGIKWPWTKPWKGPLPWPP